MGELIWSGQDVLVLNANGEKGILDHIDARRIDLTDAGNRAGIIIGKSKTGLFGGPLAQLVRAADS